MILEIVLLAISLLFWIFSIGLIVGVTCGESHVIEGWVLLSLSSIGVVYSLYIIGLGSLLWLGII